MAERETKRAYRPWHPVQVRPDNRAPENNLEIRKADCVALQALAAGVASEDQQKRAWAAILFISGLNDMVWMPEELGGERDSTFAAGKQHVGFQLRKLVTFPLNLLTGEKHDGREHDRSSGRPADERNALRAKRVG
jgi:hypothetical protein